MEKKFIRDGVSLKEFLPATRDGLQLVAKNYALPDLEYLNEPGDWASFFFVLREVPDNEAFFPSGKWATIQSLESKLIEWAKDRLSEWLKDKKESV